MSSSTSVRSSARQGFSLVESLVTMVLVLGALGLVGDLLQHYTNLARFSSGKESALLAVEVGIDRMGCELQESIAIAAPTPSGASADLRFTRIDPGRTTRFPATIPANPPPWDPAAPSDQMAVRYFLTGQTLLRTATPVGGPAATGAVAEGITRLTCRYDPSGNGCVEIAVDVQTSSQLQRSLTRVYPRAR